jgi:hypothetical protein
VAAAACIRGRWEGMRSSPPAQAPSRRTISSRRQPPRGLVVAAACCGGATCVQRGPPSARQTQGLPRRRRLPRAQPGTCPGTPQTLRARHPRAPRRAAAAAPRAASPRLRARHAALTHADNPAASRRARGKDSAPQRRARRRRGFARTETAPASGRSTVAGVRTRAAAVTSPARAPPQQPRAAPRSATCAAKRRPRRASRHLRARVGRAAAHLAPWAAPTRSGLRTAGHGRTDAGARHVSFHATCAHRPAENWGSTRMEGRTRAAAHSARSIFCSASGGNTRRRCVRTHARVFGPRGGA